MFKLILIFLSISIVSIKSDHNTNQHFRSAILNQQGVRNILQSIEEKIVKLLESPKIEAKILDTLEAKLLRRIDDKLNRVVGNVMTFEQTTRKFETIYERLNQKINYIDGGFIKLQNKLDTVSNKLDKIENSLSTRQADMENELIDVTQSVEEIKNLAANIDEKTNNATKNIASIKQLLVTRNSIATNERYTINDKTLPPNETFEKLLNNINTIFETSVETKITDLYGDQLEKTYYIENLVKESIGIMNTSRREFQDGLRSLHFQFNRILTNQSQNLNCDYSINNLNGIIQRKFTDLNQRIDSNYHNMMLAQNLFTDNCFRNQQNEESMDAVLTNVLEHYFDSISNKSSYTNREIKTLQEQLRYHDSKIYHSVGKTTNTVIELAEKFYSYKREMMEILLEIKDKLEEWVDVLQKSVLENSGGNNEENAEKLGKVNSIVQEIQERVSEMETKYTDEIFENTSKIITENITQELVVLKDKYYNISHHVSSKAENIIALLKNIYEVLHLIETKLAQIENSEFYKHFNVYRDHFENIWKNNHGNMTGVIQQLESKNKDLQNINPIVVSSNTSINNVSRDSRNIKNENIENSEHIGENKTVDIKSVISGGSETEVPEIVNGNQDTDTKDDNWDNFDDFDYESTTILDDILE